MSIAFISPLFSGTEKDTAAFLKELKQVSPVLESSLEVLTCDQSKSDILKNIKQLKDSHPNIIILGKSMSSETIALYAEYVSKIRPSIHTGEVAYALVHYENEEFMHPERMLDDCLDEYFPYAIDLIRFLKNTLL